MELGFKQIVGEMRKDFPQDLLLVFKNIVNASKSRNEEMKLTISSEDCKRFLEWFKWLGEDEQ